MENNFELQPLDYNEYSPLRTDMFGNLYVCVCHKCEDNCIDIEEAIKKGNYTLITG